MDAEMNYRILTTIADKSPSNSYNDVRGDLDDMCDAFRELDEWLRMGKRLPLSWRNAGQETKQ